MYEAAMSAEIASNHTLRAISGSSIHDKVLRKIKDSVNDGLFQCSIHYGEEYTIARYNVEAFLRRLGYFTEACTGVSYESILIRW